MARIKYEYLYVDRDLAQEVREEGESVMWIDLAEHAFATREDALNEFARIAGEGIPINAVAVRLREVPTGKVHYQYRRTGKKGQRQWRRVRARYGKHWGDSVFELTMGLATAMMYPNRT